MDAAVITLGQGPNEQLPADARRAYEAGLKLVAVVLGRTFLPIERTRLSGFSNQPMQPATVNAR